MPTLTVEEVGKKERGSVEEWEGGGKRMIGAIDGGERRGEQDKRVWAGKERSGTRRERWG